MILRSAKETLRNQLQKNPNTQHFNWRLLKYEILLHPSDRVTHPFWPSQLHLSIFTVSIYAGSVCSTYIPYLNMIFHLPSRTDDHQILIVMS